MLQATEKTFDVTLLIDGKREAIKITCAGFNYDDATKKYIFYNLAPYTIEERDASTYPLRAFKKTMMAILLEEEVRSVIEAKGNV